MERMADSALGVRTTGTIPIPLIKSRISLAVTAFTISTGVSLDKRKRLARRLSLN